MEFNQVINSRRSVRSYLKKTVDNGLIEEVIRAGTLAPSAGNICPWEFIVVKSEKQRQKIVKTTYLGNQRYSEKNQDWLIQAPVLILVLANWRKIFNRYNQAADKLVYLDGSACIENMILMAVNLSLGTCYITGCREEEIMNELSIPEHYRFVGLISLGYTDQRISPKGRKDVFYHCEFFKGKTDNE